jgi:hypothetical protein
MEGPTSSWGLRNRITRLNLHEHNDDDNDDILDPWRWYLIGCLETSARNYNHSLRNNPAERIMSLVRCQEGFSCVLVRYESLQFSAVSVVAKRSGQDSTSSVCDNILVGLRLFVHLLFVFWGTSLPTCRVLAYQRLFCSPLVLRRPDIFILHVEGCEHALSCSCAFNWSPLSCFLE